MLQNSSSNSSQNAYSQNEDLQGNPQISIEDVSPLSIGDYLIMYLVLLIPIANIIMPFVWAFGDYNVNKKNLAKAMLIFFFISVGITAVLLIIFGTLILNTLKAVGF